MTKSTPEPLAQVLRALARNREPGWNFPGHFLRLAFDEVEAGGARVSLAPGPHCVDASGAVDPAALAVLVDVALAAAMRRAVGLSARMATVTMAVQLTGAAPAGPLEARGRFEGFARGIAGRQGLARAEVHGAAGLIATCSGAFMAFDHEHTAPLPVDAGRGETEALAPAELTPEERAVYRRARRALAAGDGAFLARFWGLRARATAGGAAASFPIGVHVGNRVGHTQGGLLFALAAATASAALGEAWVSSGATACFVSPGTGPRLRARARIVHQGTLTAAVRTVVSAADGRTVLEALSSHARRGG